jgi:hypothetical protein
MTTERVVRNILPTKIHQIKKSNWIRLNKCFCGFSSFVELSLEIEAKKMPCSHIREDF